MLLNTPSGNKATLAVISYIVLSLMILVDNACLLKEEINTVKFQYTEKFLSYLDQK